MKSAIANAARVRYITEIMEFLTSRGEDVGLIASNTCNLPFVEDGEEGVLEVVVKVTKKDYDESMQERVDYVNHVAEVTDKAAAREAERLAKAAKAKAKAEAKAKSESKGE